MSEGEHTREDRVHFCQNCGARLDETANFCPNCGAAQSPRAGEQSSQPARPPETGQINTSTTPGTPPPSSQGNNRTLYFTVGGCGVLLLLLILGIVACGALIRSGANTATQGGTTSVTTTQDSTSNKKPKPDKQRTSDIKSQPKNNSAAANKSSDPNPHFSDGTYQVGKDIQAGTYRTRSGSTGCYFARLKGFSGNVSDILANQNIDDPAVVTIDHLMQDLNLKDAVPGRKIYLQLQTVKPLSVTVCLLLVQILTLAHIEVVVQGVATTQD